MKSLLIKKDWNCSRKQELFFLFYHRCIQCVWLSACVYVRPRILVGILSVFCSTNSYETFLIFHLCVYSLLKKIKGLEKTVGILTGEKMRLWLKETKVLVRTVSHMHDLAKVFGSLQQYGRRNKAAVIVPLRFAFCHVHCADDSPSSPCSALHHLHITILTGFFTLSAVESQRCMFKPPPLAYILI